MLLQHIQQDHRLFSAITYLVADSFDSFDSHEGWRVPLVLNVRNGGLASEIEYIHKYSCDSHIETTLRDPHAPSTPPTVHGLTARARPQAIPAG
jgi:hypothetical protein